MVDLFFVDRKEYRIEDSTSSMDKKQSLWECVTSRRLVTSIRNIAIAIFQALGSAAVLPDSREISLKPYS